MKKLNNIDYKDVVRIKIIIKTIKNNIYLKTINYNKF
jgi:hypothetical protein